MRSISPLPLPGPRSLAGWAGNMVRFHLDHLGYIRELFRSHGEIVALARDDPKFVFLFSPSHYRKVLTDSALFHNSVFVIRIPVDSALERLAASLLNMNGAPHQRIRRLILPSLYKAQIEQYQADIANLTAEFLQGAKSRPGAPQNLGSMLRELTLTLAMRTLFGLRSAEEAKQFGGAYEESFLLITSLMVFLFPLNLPGTRYRRLLELCEVYEGKIRRLIDERRAGAAGGNDTLSLLLRAHDAEKARLSDSELIGQLNTMLFASHDTTTHTLSFTLLLLSQYPKVHADVVDEITGVMGNRPFITLEQLPKLTLLDAVIKEALRLLPPVSFMGRLAQQDFELGDYRMPKGTTLILSPYMIHHHPELYSDADRFIPARWQSLHPAPHEYLAFGMGAHSCPGVHLANMELKTVLAQLLSQYRLVLPAQAHIDYQTRPLLCIKGGLPGRLVPQDRAFSRVPIEGSIHRIVDLSS